MQGAQHPDTTHEAGHASTKAITAASRMSVQVSRMEVLLEILLRLKFPVLCVRGTLFVLQGFFPASRPHAASHRSVHA